VPPPRPATDPPHANTGAHPTHANTGPGTLTGANGKGPGPKLEDGRICLARVLELTNLVNHSSIYYWAVVYSWRAMATLENDGDLTSVIYGVAR